MRSYKYKRIGVQREYKKGEHGNHKCQKHDVVIGGKLEAKVNVSRTMGHGGCMHDLHGDIGECRNRGWCVPYAGVGIGMA